jgi:microcystin-dependent protein
MKRKSNPCAFRVGEIVRTIFVTLAAIAAPTLVFAQGNTGVTGDGTPVENRQPGLGLRYIIAMQGIFPDNNGDPPGGTQPPYRDDPYFGEIRAVPYNIAPRGWVFCEGQLLPINQNQAMFALLGTRYGGNGVTTFALPDLRGRVPIGAGQAPGLPNYTLGQKVGTAQVSLTAANLPAHSHSVPNGHTGTTGNGDAVDNVQPSLGLTFLIAANGEIMIVPWEQQPTGWVRPSGQLLPVTQYNYLFGHLGYSYGGSGPVFALPDLRGRVVVGYNSTSEPLIGAARGTPTHTLTLADMPAHTHTIPEGHTGSTGGAGGAFDNYQPSLVMKWLISIQGGTPHPDVGTPTPFKGEMRLIAGYVADGLPGNIWKPVDGATYSELNSVVVNYGAAGKVPDLRNRIAPGPATVLASPELPVGTDTFTVSFTNLAPHSHQLLTGQQQWRLRYFGSIENSGPGADGNDFDGDGLSNLMEYATGNDPTQSSVVPESFGVSGNAMEFWYSRSKAAIADGFQFQVRFTDSLSLPSWSGSGVTEQVMSEDAEVQLVKASRMIAPNQNTSFAHLAIWPP